MFILFAMIFCHIVDDYYLQGLLASMKQKAWWEQNASDKLYKYDYIMALIMHSLSWAFMIMLPLAIFNKFEVSVLYGILLLINACIHGIVDDLKANAKKINLITDQSIHIFQICVTFLIYMFLI